MSRRGLYYLLLSIWSLIYIVGTLLAPIAPNRFNLTATKTHILQVTIALPVVLIWWIAVYGAERFQTYASEIRNHADGRALNQIGIGLTILVISTLASGINGLLRPWALEDGWLRALTIVYNYIAVFIPLIAYWVMYSGSVGLLKVNRTGRKYLGGWFPTAAIITLIGIAYIFIVFSYDYRNSTPNPNDFSSFYLPDALIITTLVFPYLIGWALGIKTVFNLLSYQREVKGFLYKQAFRRLAVGLLWVLSFAITLQLFVALSTYFSKAKLGAILAIVYLIIILYAAGFLIIASGSRKLQAIEEAK